MKLITPLLEECWATNPCKRLTIVRLRKIIQYIWSVAVDESDHGDDNVGEDEKNLTKVDDELT